MTERNPKANGNTYHVEVRLRPEFTDAEGQAVLALLNGLGLGAARAVRLSRVYEIRGPLNSAHVQQAARELLCDAVTQEYQILGAPPAAMNGLSHWRVEVWLKRSVTDPVGETVAAAMAELGLPRPEAVRVGLAYRIAGKCGRHQLEKAVLRSLANPVIHRFNVSEAHP